MQPKLKKLVDSCSGKVGLAQENSKSTCTVARMFWINSWAEAGS